MPASILYGWNYMVTVSGQRGNKTYSSGPITAYIRPNRPGQDYMPADQAQFRFAIDLMADAALSTDDLITEGDVLHWDVFADQTLRLSVQTPGEGGFSINTFYFMAIETGQPQGRG